MHGIPNKYWKNEIIDRRIDVVYLKNYNNNI